ncbi:hypothetical protein G647_01054 [Cladophialophora carrionii CBS 160.54]|uniref:NTF2-like domain-containing protein n=1 Tax=Cladophialophora carrionii CBS 160.54 TaxID=1279043 RepID=V9DQL4_9EURO|nr:uncharacterized protein G647_01054 [Cladophialophora carrionii CBS 160.54]ETI28603.1 hypothetical protein G647_01054 [Cladophialophora carrionii CBS 160.54]
MKSLLFAVFASVPFVAANPWGSNPFMKERGVCAADNCARAVTGTNAPQPLATRQADCSAFFSPLPTPTVPSYASACSGSTRYSSACSCLGVARPTYTCLSSAQAENIVKTFSSLLTAPQAPDFVSKATTLLADDFKDNSDSINFLAGYPLGATTFPSKQAFIAGQGSQPPITTVTTLEIFNTCNKIAWRWVAKGIGSAQYDVKGIDTFTINPSGQISEVNAEFNSGAWAANLAGLGGAPPSSGASSSSTTTSSTRAASTTTTPAAAPSEF